MIGRLTIVPAKELTQTVLTYVTPCIKDNCCQRCYSKQLQLEPCTICHQFCLTCQTCRRFGRSCACCVIVNRPNALLETKRVSCSWVGQLSTQQKQGAQAIQKAVQENQSLFVCAVTGAGKTEMLYPAICDALSNGKRVCLAAPRIDVVLELEPRLKQAFCDVPIMVMHGRQTEPYRFTPFVLCTTHQLIKFNEHFDVLIIDEVDSYPFHHNALLNDKAKTCVKAQCSIIYLTATPTKTLLQQVKQKQLHYFELPARYHQHALPIPKYCWVGHWKKSIQQQKIPLLLLTRIRLLLKQQKRFLLFCATIDIMLQLEQLLKKQLPATVAFTSVYANDGERIEKIQQMRQNHYHFLMTTTILERGVTFSNIDVIVFGSEEKIYTTETLIQIAGRVGRDKQFPTGNVYFLHYGKTKASQQAIAFIKRQNQRAKQLGYITC